MADARTSVGLTAAGPLVGTLVYVLADGRLNRDEHMRMRRAGHAAAAGRAMEMPQPGAGETKRGESIAAGLVITRAGVDRPRPGLLS